MSALAAAATSCGYQLAGTRVSPPGGIHSVAVGSIENRSREFGLDKALRFAFEREVYRRGLLRLIDGEQPSDALLTGTIQSFRTRPVGFDAQDEAVQYQAELIVDLALRRQDDGALLWRTAGLHAIEEYAVQANIVITSSSQFQQGTLDPVDLAQMTDIQLAETERRLAIDRLVATVARDAHDRIVEDF